MRNEAPTSRDLAPTREHTCILCGAMFTVSTLPRPGRPSARCPACRKAPIRHVPSIAGIRKLPTRIPAGITAQERHLAGEAFSIIVRAMRRAKNNVEISPLRFRAACRVRDEICGAIPQKQVISGGGTPVEIEVLSYADALKIVEAEAKNITQEKSDGKLEVGTEGETREDCEVEVEVAQAGSSGREGA